MTLYRNRFRQMFSSRRTALFIASLGLSTGTVATTIYFNFPLLDLLTSQTFHMSGYEAFKGKVDGKTCLVNEQKTPHSSVVIHFIEALHPDVDHVDGRSGASTKSKQISEIMNKFKTGGQFIITSMNGVDFGNAPLTGYYKGNAKKITLSFDNPDALIAERGVCQGATRFNVQQDKYGQPLLTASFTMYNGQQFGTLVFDGKLVDADDAHNLARYQASLTAYAGQ